MIAVFGIKIPKAKALEIEKMRKTLPSNLNIYITKDNGYIVGKEINFNEFSALDYEILSRSLKLNKITQDEPFLLDMKELSTPV